MAIAVATWPMLLVKMLILLVMDPVDVGAVATKRTTVVVVVMPPQQVAEASVIVRSSPFYHPRVSRPHSFFAGTRLQHRDGTAPYKRQTMMTW